MRRLLPLLALLLLTALACADDPASDDATSNNAVVNNTPNNDVPNNDGNNDPNNGEDTGDCLTDMDCQIEFADHPQVENIERFTCRTDEQGVTFCSECESSDECESGICTSRRFCRVPDSDPNNDAPDAGDDTPDADANNDLPDADEPDADEPDADEPDADEPDVDEPVMDPFEGRPTGQCVESADCPETGLGAGMCSRALPGGACLGCGVDAHCPDGAICNVGACAVECDTEADCAPGLRCTSQGLCAATRCVDGVCPVALFGCSDSGLCERSPCDDQAQCPAGTTCAAGRCIEDRARLTD